MKELRFEKIEAVNLEGLHQRFEAEMGGRFAGLSYSGGVLVVHVREVVDGDGAQVSKAVQEHDPRVKTPEQEERDSFKVYLEAARRQPRATIDLDSVSDPLLKALASKVLVLEAEIEALKFGL